MKKTTLLNKISLLLCVLLLISCNNESTQSGTDDEMEQVVPPENQLPLMAINTNGVTIVDEPKIDAVLTITEAAIETHVGNIAIEIRGSSSQFFDKKGYGFETRDDANEDLDVSLLGMPEEEDWILHGPYSDKSLIRNMLIYDLSRDMNRYASRTELVELSINGVYKGVYVFMEKLKRDNNRIDINKLKDDENTGEDLTGGYILKIDKADGADETFYDSANSFASNIAGEHTHFLYDTPDMDDITPEQKAYISTYVTDFEISLASNTFTDAATGYANYIDVDSFIDFFILNELSNNVDGYRLSTWLVKDKNEKLRMGPIWDFNLAFGNADYCAGGNTNVWAYKFNERCPGDIWQVPFWWERLLQDPVFVTQLQNRWNELRGNVLSDTAILGRINTYTSTMENAGAIDTNFNTWQVLGTYIWPNNFVGGTYNAEVDFMTDWIEDRLTWLDSAISSL